MGVEGHENATLAEKMTVLTNQTLTVTKNEEPYRNWDQHVINITLVTTKTENASSTIFVGEDGQG
jgi:hypothetical protein